MYTREQIQNVLHAFVEMSAENEKVVADFVMQSWHPCDQHRRLIISGVRASGKTRLLRVLEHLCDLTQTRFSNDGIHDAGPKHGWVYAVVVLPADLEFSTYIPGMDTIVGMQPKRRPDVPDVATAYEVQSYLREQVRAEGR
jgi:hypothetical protein